ncbi:MULTISPECIES: hypothetical protein [unclassified Paenibacillus]
MLRQLRLPQDALQVLLRDPLPGKRLALQTDLLIRHPLFVSNLL